MPITYRIDTAAGLMCITVTGVVTQAERLEAMRTWFADPAWRPGLRNLCDLSEAESTPTMAELREVVDAINRRSVSSGPRKMAVVTSRPVVFGVARQFVALAESTPLEIQVFTTREAGMAWLQGTDA